MTRYVTRALRTWRHELQSQVAAPEAKPGKVTRGKARLQGYVLRLQVAEGNSALKFVLLPPEGSGG